MIEIKPMNKDYIHVYCLHHGPVTAGVAPDGAPEWRKVEDLPPHPWSNETIVELSEKYDGISHGWSGEPSVEFMRDIIQSYGTCAMLAWQDKKIVGQLRFYPREIARLVAVSQTDSCPNLDCRMACEPQEDQITLWVQCVMTCRPYVGSEDATLGGRFFPKEKTGARKGTGFKLVQGLISWAREHGWKRIVKVAHCDLDCFYGIVGGGGKAFWEKAGFKVIGSYHDEYQKDDDWKATVEAQAKVKGLSKQEAWTWYHMMYEL